MKFINERSLFCLLFCIFTFHGLASTLLIQYDFLKDDYRYFELKANGEKKQVELPRVSRNHTIKVEVINFNPFVYTAVASYSSTEFNETPNLGFFNLINPLSMGGGGSAFLSQLLEFSDDPSRGTTGVLSMPEAKNAYEAVVEAYETLYKAEQMVNSIDFVLNKVYRLKYNPYLPGDTIKSFTQVLLRSLFNQKSVQTEDFMVLGNEINRTVAGGYASIGAQVERFKKAYEKYSSSRPPNFEGEGLDQTVQAWGTQAQTFVRSFNSNELLDKLDALEMLYLSIINTPFVFNTNELAKGDELKINIDFYLNPMAPEDGKPLTVTDLQNLSKVKSTDIDVTVTGDLKINSSLGLAFPYYSNNMNFINKDSLITAISGNNYTPNIAAYLNFYPYTGYNMMIGGTFGVGVPISDDSRSFNFLMGGALLFGSDNRLVLNFGATLGQVNALGRGYSAGDNLGDLTSEVPLRTTYQWGYFIGVSFSLVNVTN